MGVKEFFGKHAKEYAASTSHAKGKDLETLIRLLQLKADFKAVDLAAGTGFTSVALAKKVASVIAYDLTLEMLDEAKNLAAAEGVENIEFQRGDVQNSPFEENTFDIATCRRAAHHFKDKKAFLNEVKRILKKGGKFGLSDMIAPENDINNLFNTLENFRDPSHIGAESASSWKSLVEEAGFEIINLETTEERIEFTKWLSPVATDSEEGKSCRDFLEKHSGELAKIAGYDKKTNSLIKRRLILVAENSE